LWLKRGSLILLLAGLACWAVNFPKFLRSDQVIFESVAQGILETGKPVAHYGHFTNLGLWHPPLLFYEQALGTWLSHSPELGARLPAALGVLLAIFLAFAALRRLAGPEPAWAALFLMVASPALMYTGMVPDHDGALVLPMTLAFAWIQLDALKKGFKAPLWPAVALGCLLLWGKLTTPPLLLLGFSLGSFFWLGARQGLRAVGASALAVVFFGISWALFCVWKNINPAFTVEYMAAIKLGGPTPPLAHKLKTLWIGLQELGLPLMTLYGLLLIREKEDWRRRGAMILGLQAAIPMLAFSLWAPYFAAHPLSWKYLVPSQALLCVSCALMWPKETWWPDLGASEKKVLWIACALLLAELLAMTYDLRVWSASMLGGMAFAWFLGRRRQAPRPYLALGALLVMAMLALKFFVQMGIMGEDAPPEFPTGEKGYASVVREIQGPAYQGRTFLCRKDVGFYVPGKRVVPIDPHFSWNGQPMDIPVEARPLGAWLKSWWPYPVEDWTVYSSWERAYVNDRPGFEKYLDEVDTVIDSNYDSFLRDPSLKALVEGRFNRLKDIGHYSIYLKKPPKQSH
jgi:hypothetical protein